MLRHFNLEAEECWVCNAIESQKQVEIMCFGLAPKYSMHNLAYNICCTNMHWKLELWIWPILYSRYCFKHFITPSQGRVLYDPYFTERLNDLLTQGHTGSNGMSDY